MKEKILERFKSFIDQHGGIRKVAPRVNKSAQFFYSMFKRGTMPSVDLMHDFMKEFENFDITWLIVGEKKEMVSAPINSTMEVELEALRRKNELLQEMYFEIVKKDAKRELAEKNTVGTTRNLNHLEP
ncbi:hypothetical protein [Salmonirosea aquatica]|uniref:Uncharacterized protein n=1 Tax=Salmonirosea aquatica TaxID=2654236 RepID=A0A7C9F9H1_9BACT|nr:hypothetical protein [Cytophagaceae bacterium SJW1-29]